MRILFDSKSEKYKKPFGCIKTNQSCEINIKIPPGCGVSHVQLVFNYEDSSEYMRFDMQNSGEQSNMYTNYNVRFSIPDNGLYFYYFEIYTNGGSFRLYKHFYDQTNMNDGSYWQLTVTNHQYYNFDDYTGGVMYQIFPDRFFKHGECDCTDKIEPYVVHKSQDESPIYQPDKDGIVQNNDFFGGNLHGIIQKLPYLKSLNVNILYLNPIVMAYSNHRYDTADYKRVDPMLGTQEDFEMLCKEAHKLGMKIILDGVFSHTGEQSIYFDKYNMFTEGAYHNPDSPYRNWFQFNEYPDNYTSWWGISTLPCTQELDEGFIKYIITDEDSVVNHWLRLGADGYRLDVADELPAEFLRLLNEQVHKVKENAIVIGEVWEDASNKVSYGYRTRYFVDNELDTTMNYPFRKSIISLILGDINEMNFEHEIMTIVENYPKEAVDVLMNSLSTHDTMRILTELGCKNYPQDKSMRGSYKLSHIEKVRALNAQKLAAFLQFTLPGNPCIYYGDEIGMEGFEDPFNRRFFDWENPHKLTLKFYKDLATMRVKTPPLKDGKIKFNKLSNNVVSFTRYNDDDEVIAVINLGDDYAYKKDNEFALISNQVDTQDDSLLFKKYGFALLHKISTK